MTRKLRTLGIALVAVFAMSAVVASAASATTFKDTINSEKSTTVLTGTQTTKHKFTTAAGLAFECTTVLLHGTLTKAAGIEEVTVVPTYSGCTFGVNPATITMNKCDWILNGTTHTNAKGEKHATTQINCSTGGPVIAIDMPAISCTLTIAPQTTVNGFTIKNEGVGTTRDLLLTFTETFTTSRHGTSVACLGAGTTATYSGTSTVEGYEDLGGSGHTGTEGKHVGIFFTEDVI